MSPGGGDRPELAQQSVPEPPQPRDCRAPPAPAGQAVLVCGPRGVRSEVWLLAQAPMAHPCSHCNVPFSCQPSVPLCG